MTAALAPEVQREDPARAFLWATLACAFTYPGEEMLARLRTAVEDLPAALAMLALGEAPGAGEVVGAAKERIPELQGLYNRLFITALEVPLAETAYELDKAARKASELADIQGFYRAFGLRLGAPIEPDHLVAELEFLSLLAQKVRYFAATGDAAGYEVSEKAYRAFLEDHLGRWFEIFARRLREATEDPFYRLFGGLLERFVAAELARLDLRPQKLTRWVVQKPAASSWACGAGPGNAQGLH